MRNVKTDPWLIESSRKKNQTGAFWIEIEPTRIIPKSSQPYPWCSTLAAEDVNIDHLLGEYLGFVCV